MIQSMTGYGRQCVVFEGKKIIAEIKSVNSKALDLTCRITAAYREKEMEIRQQIAQRVERGKVDFALWIEREEAGGTAVINTPMVAEYYRQMKTLCAEIGMREPDNMLGTLMRMPDVLTHTETTTLSDEEWSAAHEAVSGAIEQLVAFRTQEGAALERKFCEKIDNIEALMTQIEPFEKGRVERIRQRLEEELANLKGVDIDRGRLEQELIYYIEKLDISEEKQRLANHLNYFRQTMHEGHGQGKKLGFIAQEMGREINTTGSKSNQAEMQNIVVMMKDELEQIKEQVLNVM